MTTDHCPIEQVHLSYFIVVLQDLIPEFNLARAHSVPIISIIPVVVPRLHLNLHNRMITRFPSLQRVCDTTHCETTLSTQRQIAKLDVLQCSFQIDRLLGVGVLHDVVEDRTDDSLVSLGAVG